MTGIRRGEIHLVGFDPTIGHEIQKTRPAVIIQNDVGNRYSSLTIVAAVTSRVSSEPFPVEVTIEPTKRNGLSVRSSIRLDHIRTVDKQRLVRRLGKLDSSSLKRVDEAIKISLGLIGL
jgi:mRNA interferase MazF